MKDLSGDGKITQKDVLMGRGVIPKKKMQNGGVVKTTGAMKKRYMNGGVVLSGRGVRDTKMG
jgi:hypothetical protein|tara:strand:+ start:25 stop:210 length:186 start_codon:yes stop_codon:yes gene_type:complete